MPALLLNRPPRPVVSVAARCPLALTWALTLALGGCAATTDTTVGEGRDAAVDRSATAAPAIDRAAASNAFRARADGQVIEHGGVEVKVAVLHAPESLAWFGVPLSNEGVQPVWVSIRNRSRESLWLMPVFMDRDFFSAREVAYRFRMGDEARNQQMESTLASNQIRVHVPAGASTEGFVYTNLTRGIKLVNVELFTPGKLLRFAFARELPGGGFDFETVDVNRHYPREQQRDVSARALGPALDALICCTTDADGQQLGDPLNLALVGTEHEVQVALVRAGWDFTETINAGSVGKMVESFVAGSSYRNSPVSSLHFDRRKQDFAMQRARASISQRNHLRLWITPLRVEGKPVWIGQISRDIGVRVTLKSPSLTTHKIDPDIDESRDYLLQDLLMSASVARWGMAPGVGAAPAAAPRANLTGDPYFTDGKRLVLFVSDQPRAIPQVEVIEWNMSEK